MDEDEGNPFIGHFIGYFDVIDLDCGHAITQD
jgi:hypothetical protein